MPYDEYVLQWDALVGGMEQGGDTLGGLREGQNQPNQNLGIYQQPITGTQRCQLFKQYHRWVDLMLIGHLHSMEFVLRRVMVTQAKLSCTHIGFLRCEATQGACVVVPQFDLGYIFDLSYLFLR